MPGEGHLCYHPLEKPCHWRKINTWLSSFLFVFFLPSFILRFTFYNILYISLPCCDHWQFTSISRPSYLSNTALRVCWIVSHLPTSPLLPASAIFFSLQPCPHLIKGLPPTHFIATNQISFPALFLSKSTSQAA